MSKTKASTLEAFLQMVPTVDVTGELPAIKRPTLVITTTGSGLGDVASVKAWQETIPGLEAGSAARRFLSRGRHRPGRLRAEGSRLLRSRRDLRRIGRALARPSFGSMTDVPTRNGENQGVTP